MKHKAVYMAVADDVPHGFFETLEEAGKYLDTLNANKTVINVMFEEVKE